MNNEQAAALGASAPGATRRSRTMLTACLIVFMAQMATTVYLPSLTIVARDLRMSQSLAELSISIFVVGAAVPVPFWGQAAQRWGRRRPLLISLALFAVTSGLLMLSRTAPELLTLRALQGIGGGGAAIIARIVVRDNWSGDELARRLSVLSIAFITALGGGQFLGGLIGQYSRWQTGFALMALTAAGAAALVLTVPLQPGVAAADSGMWRAYRAMLRRPGFIGPACAGGLGFATTVTLQEVSPFVFREHFHLAVMDFGGFGLLIGLAYFSGAMVVNRLVGRLGGRALMRNGAGIIGIATLAMPAIWFVHVLPANGAWLDTLALWLFMGLYCATIFGQAVLFPNTMALAVSDAREYGAHAMALCGFLQQGLAGIAAAASVLFRHGASWTVAVVALGLATALQVGFKAAKPAKAGN